MIKPVNIDVGRFFDNCSREGARRDGRNWALRSPNPDPDIWDAYATIHLLMPDGSMKLGGKAVAEVLRICPARDGLPGPSPSTYLDFARSRRYSIWPIPSWPACVRYSAAKSCGTPKPLDVTDQVDDEAGSDCIRQGRAAKPHFSFPFILSRRASTANGVGNSSEVSGFVLDSSE